jgi:CRISPR system Cascade subunit CasE
MHLTRIPINRNSRGGTKLLGNAQAMHAAVESCFPPEANPADGAGRLLWRVDRSPKHTHLYIVSATKPDPRVIIEQAGWPAADTVGYDTRDYSELLAQLRPGSQFAFRVEVNAMRSPRELHGDHRSKKVPVHGDDNLIEWLTSRGDTSGATFTAVRVISNTRDDVRRESHSPILNRTTLTGTLTVTDADKFRATLTSGIGPSKAYGCGLMTLAPAVSAG